MSYVTLQLLRRMDHGEAVQIAGIPDIALQGQLDQLFHHLHLRKSLQVCGPAVACCSSAVAILTGPNRWQMPASLSWKANHRQLPARQACAYPQGIYTQRKGASPALALLSPIIDEVPAAPAVRSATAGNGSLAAHAAPEPATELAARPSAAANGSSVARAAQEPAPRTGSEARPAATGSAKAHTARAPVAGAVAGPSAAAALDASGAADASSEGAEEAPSSSAPHAARSAAHNTGQRATELSSLEGGVEVRGAGAPGIGPAMPPGVGLPDGGGEGPDEGDHPGSRAAGACEAAVEGLRAGARDGGAGGVGQGTAGGGAEQGDGPEARAAPARVVGPAMPSAELLRAAAEATEAVRRSTSR